MNQLAARVPVGFRFHPMDEELVGYYLPKKIGDRKIDLDLIRDVDLYKLEPWDLHDFCKNKNDPNEKQTDYYFFSRKDKKYPTGNRSNRATLKGFWKATGRDKPIYTKLDQTLIGMRKTLVFYQGRAPHGIKTDWIMHEFRLDDGPDQPAHEDGGWVICRVFKKNKYQKMKMQHEGAISHDEHVGAPLPEPVPPSDILAGGGLLERPHHGVKQEIVNLDAYQPQSNQHLNQREFGLSFKDDSIHRAIRLMKPDAANISRFSSNDDSNTGLWQIRHPQTSSGSGATELNDYETIGGTLDNIDWSAWLQDPVQPGLGPEDLLRCPSTTKISSDDVTSPLLQLKRQNSDIFSSLYLWNDTQDFQQM